MIDFHSHILPNVDDGSKSVEETFELLEEAKNAGVPDTAWFPEKQALTDYVISQIQKGDILWVKGSHGMALETLIEAIYKQP